MAWLPWAELPRRSNITPYELIDWLRHRAIEFGASTAFIDAIDGLYAYSTQDERIEELEEELEDAENMIARIRKEAEASVNVEARIEAIQDILDED
jgi:hypothetical protein